MVLVHDQDRVTSNGPQMVLARPVIGKSVLHIHVCFAQI